MKDNRHRQFERIVTGSDTVVLLIHGIIGTPAHFKDFLPFIPKTWSVCNLLLDGHGIGVRDFGNTSMEKWKEQVSQKLNELCEMHERIYIVAHSMGTLFAMQGAIDHPDYVKGMMLLAAPLKIRIKRDMPINTAKVFFGKVKETDHRAVAAYNAYGIKRDMNIFKYVGWIARYAELFREIKRVRGIVNQIAVPCYVYQSEKDEMVSLSAAELLKENQHIKVDILQNSAHYYYEKTELKYLLNEFQNMIGTESN